MSLDSKSFDPVRDYPLGARRPDLVSTPGGLPLADVTLENLLAGRIDANEIRATSQTLRLQAQVARAADRAPLGSEPRARSRAGRGTRRASARRLHGAPPAASDRR